MQQVKLNDAIASIKTLHTRFSYKLAISDKRRSGNDLARLKMHNANFLIGHYIEILEDYSPLGSPDIDDTLYHLTESEINSIITDCFTKLGNYMNRYFLPSDPNLNY